MGWALTVDDGGEILRFAHAVRGGRLHVSRIRVCTGGGRDNRFRASVISHGQTQPVETLCASPAVYRVIGIKTNLIDITSNDIKFYIADWCSAPGVSPTPHTPDPKHRSQSRRQPSQQPCRFLSPSFHISTPAVSVSPQPSPPNQPQPWPYRRARTVIALASAAFSGCGGVL